jgi:hypothetical protein
MSPRAFPILAGGLLLAGIALGIANLGVVGNAVAIVVGGVGAVLLVTAVFYAVGRSEDRDRDGR